MQKRGLTSLSLTVLLALSGYRPAMADYYAFAGGSYDRTESLVLSFAGGGYADVYTDGFQGWIGTRATNFSTGGPDGNTSYLTGDHAEGLFNDYFAFDLSGQSGTVTSASMTVARDTVMGNLTWSLHAPTVPAASLNDALSPNPTLYEDLVGGPLYGSAALRQTDTSNTVTVIILGLLGVGIARYRRAG
jgi:hypothetical protein